MNVNTNIYKAAYEDFFIYKKSTHSSNYGLTSSLKCCKMILSKTIFYTFYADIERSF